MEAVNDEVLPDANETSDQLEKITRWGFILRRMPLLLYSANFETRFKYKNKILLSSGAPL